jgi:hypothetical protein
LMSRCLLRAGYFPARFLAFRAIYPPINLEVVITSGSERNSLVAFRPAQSAESRGMSAPVQKITFAEMRARVPSDESKKTSRPSSGGFRLTSALRFLCLLFLGFRLLRRFLCGFLG